MLSQLILSFLFTLLVNAQDPSTPCISGTCTYQAGDGSSMAHSVLTINTESDTSLSDITGAAGWHIIECDPSSVGTQDIRLVCVDKSKGCDHLFKGGEEHTIVRLPDSCTGGPFARVVRSWISDDQTVPARLRKRHIDAPVRALTLDFDFSQIPESNGKVYITVSATNSQAQRDAIIHSAAKRSLTSMRHAKRTSQAKAAIREFVEASEKRSPTMKIRGRFDWVGDVANSVGNAVTHAANQVRDALSDGANAVSGGVREDASVANDRAHQSRNSIARIVDTGSSAAQNSTGDDNRFKETASQNVHLVNIDQSFPVLTASVICPGNKTTPGFDASVSVMADVKAKLDADFGIIVAGSIVPLEIDELVITATMTGGVAAVFDIKANVEGTFDSGSIPLLESGIPGLDFPGILTVGPSMSVKAQADAFLGTVADLKVSSNFDLPQVSLVYPPNQGQSAARVTPKKTPINVNVGASEKMTGHANIRIITHFDIGVDILGGTAKTTVFLEAEGSTVIDFTLSADANAAPVSGTQDQPTVSLHDVETSFRGSVNADERVLINTGATVALASFFTRETPPITLFSKTFPLIRKTFGKHAARPSVLLERADTTGLICPSADSKINLPILDVPGATPKQ